MSGAVKTLILFLIGLITISRVTLIDLPNQTAILGVKQVANVVFVTQKWSNLSSSFHRYYEDPCSHDKIKYCPLGLDNTMCRFCGTETGRCQSSSVVVANQLTQVKCKHINYKNNIRQGFFWNFFVNSGAEKTQIISLKLTT